MADRSVTFTGIRFENPFLLSSAPPTESETNILRAFEAGWGGVVTKTIGLQFYGLRPSVDARSVLYGNVLSVWDRLFRSYTAAAREPQRDMRIGLNEFRLPAAQTLPALLPELLTVQTVLNALAQEPSP